VKLFGTDVKHPTKRYEDDGTTLAYTRGEFKLVDNEPTEIKKLPVPGPRSNTLFRKNESPSGFPYAPTLYFYGDEGLDHPAGWKLVQDGVVLARQTTPSTGKVRVPQFENVGRPADLHKPLQLVGIGDPIPVSVLDRAFDVARLANATSSSSEHGYSPAGVIDGNASGYPHGKQFEWASDHEKTGAWVKLEWAQPQTIDTIWIYDRPNTTDQVLGGVLTFDDGTTLDVGELPNDGTKPNELSFPAKTARSVTFQITKVTESTQNAGVAEIAAFRPADK
jgi:hypothetical protein